MPVINETDYYMYNWSKFIFTWTHGSDDLSYNTHYTAWYRSRYIFSLASPLVEGQGEELLPIIPGVNSARHMNRTRNVNEWWDGWR